jgi:hypothetical protein
MERIERIFWSAWASRQSNSEKDSEGVVPPGENISIQQTFFCLLAFDRVDGFIGNRHRFLKSKVFARKAKAFTQRR